MAQEKQQSNTPNATPNPIVKKLLTDRKTQIFTVVGILVVFLGIIGISMLFGGSKNEGTWRYAVCRTFLERHHEYPQTIDIFAVGERQSDVTIYYTVHNAFGATEVNNIFCTYKMIGNSGRAVFDKVQINGKDLEKDILDKFSFTIPYILQSNPDVTLPPPLTSALDQIKKRKPFHIKIEGIE